MRCKMKLEKVVDEGDQKRTLVFHPVADSADNTTFFATTPTGRFLLSVVAAPGNAAFVEGKDYLVDFTEAPSP